MTVLYSVDSPWWTQDRSGQQVLASHACIYTSSVVRLDHDAGVDRPRVARAQRLREQSPASVAQPFERDADAICTRLGYPCKAPRRSDQSAILAVRRPKSSLFLPPSAAPTSRGGLRPPRREHVEDGLVTGSAARGGGPLADQTAGAGLTERAVTPNAWHRYKAS